VKKILGSYLKALAFINVAFGIVISVWSLGYLLILGLFFVGFGVLIYGIDFLVFKNVESKSSRLKFQLSIFGIYCLLISWAYLDWQEHNEIILPNNFEGQAAIIFGIKEFPPLSKTNFWKKRIEFPENGIIITSTQVNEIPSMLRLKYANGEDFPMSMKTWDANSKYPCISTPYEIEFWSFNIGDIQTQNVQLQLKKLADSINSGQLTCFDTTRFSPIVSDLTGNYLHLQNRGLAYLPESVSNLDVYKVILTGNEFTEVPKQLYGINSLTTLYLSQNELDTLPIEFLKLKKLEVLGLNGNNLKTIPDTILMSLPLRSIYFDNNEITEKELKRLRDKFPNAGISM